MRMLRYYKGYLKKFNIQIGILIIINVLSLLVSLLFTYLTGKYVDLLTNVSSIDWILQFALIILFIGILNIVLNNLNAYVFAKSQSNMVFKLNASLLKHVKKLPLSYFKNIDIVYLNQRINADTNVVINFIITILVNLILQIISFSFITYYLFKQNLVIAIIAILSIPLYIFMYLKFRHKLYETNYEVKEQQGIFFSHMHEQLANIKFTKINVLFEKLDNILIEKFPALLNSLLKNTKYKCYFSSTKSIIENCFNIFLFFYGGVQIFKNQMTIGSFIIVQRYFSLWLNNISAFVEIVKQYPDALVSHNRIVDIYKLPVEHNGKKVINTINTIKLDKLCFSYGDQDEEYVLKDFSYAFEKGKTYLITGDNGTGKSTLIDVMLGLYMGSYEGDIYYNNINIEELDLYYLRQKLISVLEQEPLLTDYTMHEDLTEKTSKINGKSIEYWIDKLKLHDINERTKNKDNGETLVSGGEKQKLALIRTLSKDADVVIMDEPTSALDKNSIEILMEIIKEIKHNKIIIIITHNTTLKSIADHIIKIYKNSAFVEEGATDNECATV